MKAADLFIQALENEGVEYIFGIPGEENLDFLESLKHSKIKLILTRHEQGAGFMAATYGRLTGRTGVCLSTLGPGATNLVTAAAYAQLGGMPLLLITGQKPVKKSKQGRFQIIDVVNMMKPLTKWARQIVHGNTLPALAREAFRIAEEERPGAVHLELPEDIAREETEAPLISSGQVRRPAAEEKAVARAVEMIEGSRRPLILIGAGANRKLVSKSLQRLIDHTGIPFFNTQMGKGVIDERHPSFLGTAALSADDYLHCAIERADLVINVGHDVVEKPPFFMESGGKKVIHINYFSAAVDEIYFPDIEVVGDIANALWQIGSQVKKSSSWEMDYFQRVKEEVEKNITQGANQTSFPILPQRLVAEIRNVMPEEGIIALDNGIYKIWFARNYKTYAPNTILLDNALATMGAGLPSAMAAKMVRPDKKVMAICGDGGFMMNSQELATAVQLKLNMVVVVLRDDAYGMIKWKQAGMGFDSFGLDFENPDFVRYAEAYGAAGHRVKSSEELASTLEKALNSKGVHLVEIPVDYSQNEKTLIEELRSKTCLL